MNKKGFTLVEVIAVIILLSLIALLAFPPIINKIRNTKNDLSESSKKVLFSATELFVTNNVSLYPKTNGNKYCITIDMLKKNNYLPTSVYDTKGNEIAGTTKIAVSVSNSNFSYEIDDNCKTILAVPPTPPTN